MYDSSLEKNIDWGIKGISVAILGAIWVILKKKLMKMIDESIQTGILSSIFVIVLTFLALWYNRYYHVDIIPNPRIRYRIRKFDEIKRDNPELLPSIENITDELTKLFFDNQCNPETSVAFTKMLISFKAKFTDGSKSSGAFRSDKDYIKAGKTGSWGPYHQVELTRDDFVDNNIRKMKNIVWRISFHAVTTNYNVKYIIDRKFKMESGTWAPDGDTFFGATRRMLIRRHIFNGFTPFRTQK